MADKTWTITRTQLIDALTSIRIEGIHISGPLAGKIIADDMADAILAAIEDMEFATP